jgi:hypothetical protein
MMFGRIGHQKGLERIAFRQQKLLSKDFAARLKHAKARQIERSQELAHQSEKE